MRIARHALAFAVGCLAGAGPLAAHNPHDVVNQIALSPTYPQDGMAMGWFLLTDHSVFALSTDGGRHWIESGADVGQSWPQDFALSPRFAVDGTAFAATAYGGVFRTTDHGVTWETVNAGLASTKARQVAVSPAFPQDRRVAVATDAGLFVSADAGDTWSPPVVGLVEASTSVVRFGRDPAVLYGGGAVVHRSQDGGATWTPLAAFPHAMKALAVAPSGGARDTLAVAFGPPGDGVWVSLDSGFSFAASNLGLDDPWVNDVDFADDGTMFAAGHAAGCYRSAGPFTAWTVSRLGMADNSGQTTDHTRTVAVSPGFSRDGIVFLGTFEGLYVSADRGEHWTEQSVYAPRVCRELHVSPGFAQDRAFYLGGYGGSAFEGVLGEPGVGPVAMAGPGFTTPVDGSVATPRDLAHRGTSPAPQPACADGVGCGHLASASHARHDDDGTAAHVEGGAAVPCEGDGTCAGAEPGDDDAAGDDKPGDGSSPIEPGPGGGLGGGSGSGAGGSGGYGPPPAPQPWPGADRRVTWTSIGLGVDPWSGSMVLSPDFARDGTMWYGYQGVHRSTDRGRTWTKLDNPGFNVVRALGVSPDYATDRTVFLGSGKGGTYRSTDAGNHWTDMTELPVDAHATDIRCSPSYRDDGLVFVATFGHGLWRSDDRGVHWTLTTLAPTILRQIAFSPDFAADGTMFVGAAGAGFHRSFDRGETWEASNAGLGDDLFLSIEDIAVSPGFARDRTLFVTPFAGGVYRSTDAGSTWVEAGRGLPPDAPRQLEISPAFAQDRILIQTNHEWVYVTRDAGGTWTRLPGFVRVDEDHPTVTYAGGGWQSFTPTAGIAHSLRVRQTKVASASTEFAFRGDAIAFHAQRGPKFGVAAEVRIDDHLVEVLDLYAPSVEPLQPVFHRELLRFGWHVIRITHGGPSPSAPAGDADPILRSDGFAVGF